MFLGLFELIYFSFIQILFKTALRYLHFIILYLLSYVFIICFIISSVVSVKVVLSVFSALNSCRLLPPTLNTISSNLVSVKNIPKGAQAAGIFRMKRSAPKFKEYFLIRAWNNSLSQRPYTCVKPGNALCARPLMKANSWSPLYSANNQNLFLILLFT